MFNVGQSNIVDNELHLSFKYGSTGSIYEPSYMDANGNSVKLYGEEDDTKDYYTKGLFAGMKKNGTYNGTVFNGADFDPKKEASTLDVLCQSMDMLEKFFGKIFNYGYTLSNNSYDFKFRVTDYDKGELCDDFDNLNTSSIAFFGGTFLDLSTGYVTLNRPDYATPIALCKIADLFRAVEDPNYTDDQISDRIAGFIAMRLSVGFGPINSWSNDRTPNFFEGATNYRDFAAYGQGGFDSSHIDSSTITDGDGDASVKAAYSYTGSIFASIVKQLKEMDAEVKKALAQTVSNKGTATKVDALDIDYHLFFERLLPYSSGSKVLKNDYTTNTFNAVTNFFKVNSQEYKDYMNMDINAALAGLFAPGVRLSTSDESSVIWTLFAAWVEALRKSLMQALMIKQVETKSHPEDYLNLNNTGSGDAPSTMYTPLITSLTNGPTQITNYSSRISIDNNTGSVTRGYSSYGEAGMHLIASCMSLPYVGEHYGRFTRYSPLSGFLDLCGTIQEAGTTDEAFFAENTRPKLLQLRNNLNAIPGVSEVLSAIGKVDDRVIDGIDYMINRSAKRTDKSLSGFVSPLNPMNMAYVTPGTATTALADVSVNRDAMNNAMLQGTENGNEMMSVFTKDLFRVIKCYIDTYRGANNW